MRYVGVIDRPTGEPGMHTCRPFRRHADFRADAVAFLDEGERRGERLVYVADADVDSLRLHLADLDVERLEGQRRLLLQPARALYEPGGRFDGAAQVATYRRLVSDALADGCAGLRVAADATVLVGTEAARRTFAEYELTVDRFIASAPMAAMCAYDASALGDDAVDDLAAVHPVLHGANGDGKGDGALHAFYDEARLCLVGEADIGTAVVLEAVANVIEASPDDPVLVDLGGLSFIDARGLARLDGAAGRVTADGRSVKVLDPSPVVRRCCTVLGLDRLAAGMEAA